jgi:hypothetical protein
VNLIELDWRQHWGIAAGKLAGKGREVGPVLVLLRLETLVKELLLTVGVGREEGMRVVERLENAEVAAREFLVLRDPHLRLHR